jgi:hypothetical protein
MGLFPRKEADALALANDMETGLKEHADIFPAPPVPPADLKVRLDTYLKAHADVKASEALLEEKTEIKEESYHALTEDMKSNLRYAENVTKFDDTKLRLIGWSGRKPKTPLQAPGQCRTLTVARTEDNVIVLDWKVPRDGGKTAAYKIQRKESTSTNWEVVGIALTTEIKFENQTRGKEYEYRVIAVNKAGEGNPSNTVRVVI